MATISGVVQILEGTNAQVTPVQYQREIVWTTDYKAFRYVDCSGVAHYIHESGVSDHAALNGLGFNDHPQYILEDGTNAFTGTVSGIAPTESAHLATKAYVDAIGASVSGVSDHGLLTGLTDNDHTQYTLIDGSIGFTGTVSGIAPTEDLHLSTKLYVDTQVAGSSGVADHGLLTGLSDNDHIQYILVDGTKSFSGTVSGVAPTEDLHLSTKLYVDQQVAGVSGVADHGNLTGLSDNDHTQYSLIDGTSAYTGTVSGVTPVDEAHLATKGYVDSQVSASSTSGVVDHMASGDIHFFQEEIDHTRIQNIGTNSHSDIDTHIADTTIHYISGNIDHGALQGLADNDHPQYALFTSLDTHSGDATIHFTEGSIDHGSITGLTDNDHTQYSLINGTVAYTGTISGVTPTEDAHLTTKAYVDTQVAASSGVGLHNIDYHSDVSTSGVSKDDVLKWNGTTWVPVPEGTTFEFSINSFQGSPTTTPVLIGTGIWMGVGGLTFTATYTNGPATNGYISYTEWDNLTMSGSGFEGPTTNDETVSYPSVGSSRTMTLNATDGVDNDTTIERYYFYNYRFWGVDTNTLTTEADIEALGNSELSNSRTKTFTVTAAVGEYIWYCYPDRLGTATFFVGGFEGGFEAPQTVSVTNSKGFTEDYYAYRSTNSGLGETTVEVT